METFSDLDDNFDLKIIQHLSDYYKVLSLPLNSMLVRYLVSLEFPNTVTCSQLEDKHIGLSFIPHECL